jgi:hypothetical protein
MERFPSRRGFLRGKFLFTARVSPRSLYLHRPPPSIRLIQTNNKNPSSFLGYKIPKYAIPLHTWNSDRELSFQELVAANINANYLAREKPGYIKIVKTCRKAMQNGI